MASDGIRELKDHLSRFIRRIEAGERIAITAHGRVVAELAPPGAHTTAAPSRFDELVASGVIRSPLKRNSLQHHRMLGTDRAIYTSRFHDIVGLAKPGEELEREKATEVIGWCERI